MTTMEFNEDVSDLVQCVRALDGTIEYTQGKGYHIDLTKMFDDDIKMCEQTRNSVFKLAELCEGVKENTFVYLDHGSVAASIFVLSGFEYYAASRDVYCLVLRRGEGKEVPWNETSTAIMGTSVMICQRNRVLMMKRDDALTFPGGVVNRGEHMKKAAINYVHKSFTVTGRTRLFDIKQLAFVTAYVEQTARFWGMEDIPLNVNDSFFVWKLDIPSLYDEKGNPSDPPAGEGYVWIEISDLIKLPNVFSVCKAAYCALKKSPEEMARGTKTPDEIRLFGSPTKFYV